MKRARQYAKAICAFIGAVLATVAQVYGDQPWITLAIGTLTAFVVYIVPNIPQEVSDDPEVADDTDESGYEV